MPSISRAAFAVVNTVSPFFVLANKAMRLPFFLGFTIAAATLAERYVPLDVRQSLMTDVFSEVWAPRFLTLLLAIWAWDFGWSLLFREQRSDGVVNGLETCFDTMVGVAGGIASVAVLIGDFRLICQWLFLYLAVVALKCFNFTFAGNASISRNRLVNAGLAMAFMFASIYGLLLVCVLNIDTVLVTHPK
jgi:hypothetical protein